MIQFLKTWANQIIVAVIISTALEMLLPKGNNKKYIKMVIGLYVLFAVIQPVFAKVTGNSIEIEKFDYQKYFKNSSVEASSSFEQDNTKLIQKAYIENVKNDIIAKIKKRGYEVICCDAEMIEMKEKYGSLKKITLTIKKSSEQKERTNKISPVENINIQVANQAVQANLTEEKNQLSEKEKQEIIEYLSNEYSIEKTNIIIH